MLRSRWRCFVQIPVILMLHYVYFLNAGYALSSPDSTISDAPRELANLAEKWNLTANGVSFQGMTFQLDYIVSDFIIDSMMEATAWNTECREGGVAVPAADMEFTIVPDTTPPGAGDFERNISVNVTVNPDTLGDSIIYREIFDGDGQKWAKVEFCMRFSLYTNGATPMEVNFLETLVGFSADLTAGFSIDAINVEPKEVLVATAMEDFEVDAYQCDRDNNELTGTALSRARNQGEVIRVCVTPNQEAREQGVYMRAIESFSWSRNYGGPLGLITQVAIENSQEASNFLTVLSCTPGSLVCVFSTVLIATMYLSPGVVDGSGIALLQIGDDSERRRRNEEKISMYRSLQEEDDGLTASEFSLAFEPILGELYNGVLRTASSAETSVLFSIVSVGAMTSLNLIFVFI